MNVVVDASVALKWFIGDQPNEQDVDRALSLLSAIEAGRVRLIQPIHWLIEVLAVAVRVRPAFAAETYSKLTQIPSEIATEDAVFLRAAELSGRLKQHLFDSLYHAVALQRGATLITADERYYGAAAQEGAVQRLSDFKAD